MVGFGDNGSEGVSQSMKQGFSVVVGTHHQTDFSSRLGVCELSNTWVLRVFKRFQPWDEGASARLTDEPLQRFNGPTFALEPEVCPSLRGPTQLEHLRPKAMAFFEKQHGFNGQV